MRRPAGDAGVKDPPGFDRDFGARHHCRPLPRRQVEAVSAFPPVPLTVVTAGRLQSPPWLGEEERKKARELREMDQQALAGMRPDSRHIILPDSGHNVVDDATKAVIREIKDMIQIVRS